MTKIIHRKSVQEKIDKYYKEHPLVEIYKGWKIRKNTYYTKYLGKIINYTCDVQPGVESCQSTSIQMVRDWIDKKIKEGKIQKEDI